VARAQAVWCGVGGVAVETAEQVLTRTHVACDMLRTGKGRLADWAAVVTGHGGELKRRSAGECGMGRE